MLAVMGNNTTTQQREVLLILPQETTIQKRIHQQMCPISISQFK